MEHNLPVLKMERAMMFWLRDAAAMASLLVFMVSAFGLAAVAQTAFA